MKLADTNEGFSGHITAIDGDSRLISRVASIGLVPGGEVEILKNAKHQPVLMYCRNSMIAINKEDAGRIEVEA